MGVRELKQSLSEALRAVGRGEHIRVTSRGRPLADIVPAGAADNGLRNLVVEGKVSPPSRSRPSRPPPPVPARHMASDFVLDERDAER